jgi:molybdopterin-guanine dinucleotide biosynthesis protein A
MPRPARPQIEACILAGGLSRRMGRDKARLRIGGRSLLAHARGSAMAAGLPVRVIRRDLVPRCGPVGGVFTGLATTNAEAVLFLSCDMPFVPPAALRRLVAAMRRGDRAVFYTRRPGPAGFPFLVKATALGAVAARIMAGRFSLQSLVKALHARLLPLPAGCAWGNINTLADLAAARARVRRSLRRRATRRV